jgi:hypothetical protein
MQYELPRKGEGRVKSLPPAGGRDRNGLIRRKSFREIRTGGQKVKIAEAGSKTDACSGGYFIRRIGRLVKTWGAEVRQSASKR